MTTSGDDVMAPDTRPGETNVDREIRGFCPEDGKAEKTERNLGTSNTPPTFYSMFVHFVGCSHRYTANRKLHGTMGTDPELLWMSRRGRQAGTRRRERNLLSGDALTVGNSS
ncbi:hypothetical protein ACOMHN_046254 [Nucella lapillus]